MRAIQITSFGGPEVLELTDLPDPIAPEGFEIINIDSAGVNYADTHQAENTYLAPQQLPLVPGAEAVGRLPDGRRVVALLGGGGYAEKAVVHPAMAFELPDDVTDGQALALVLQGLTAWHLLRTCAHLQPGESVVVHAAAGGVGSLAVQLAKRFGADRVIGVASSAEKRALAGDLGADATLGETDDLKGAIEDANDGHKVDVVLEMVGGTTFDASLAALAPFGRMICYGMAGRRPPNPVQPGDLMRRSRAVIGFWLAHCVGRPEMLQPPMAELIAMVQDGALRPVVGKVYPLSGARQSHEDIRSRRTIGKLTLDAHS